MEVLDRGNHKLCTISKTDDDGFFEVVGSIVANTVEDETAWKKAVEYMNKEGSQNFKIVSGTKQ